jgi:hypothetical protein
MSPVDSLIEEIHYPHLPYGIGSTFWTKAMSEQDESGDGIRHHADLTVSRRDVLRHGAAAMAGGAAILGRSPAFGQAPTYVQSTYCGGANNLMGVPITYVSGNHTFPNDAVLSGIYCVSGDIKLHAGVSGTAVLVAGGKISTSGLGQNLIEDVDVVHFSVGNADKRGNVSVQVEQSVHLDGGLALAKPGPRE